VTVPEPEDATGVLRVRRIGHLGRITLDRPAQINALTLEMIVRMRTALLRWEADPRIRQVLIDGAGERGFCAGGDIRVVHESARDRTGEAGRLWREEYLLDALIGDYAKPVVVVMDGVTMGGGIGLGGHASHRLVTERSVLAMPEVKLGISPDVGGTLLFARAPGLLGRHLAMTGDRFGPGDAVHLGIADSYVRTSRLPRLLELLTTETAGDAVAAVGEPPPPSPLQASRAWIDDSYSADDAGAVLTRLRNCGVPDAAAAADRIEAASPLAVCVALRAVERAGDAGTLPAVLGQDLRIGLRLIEGSDPVEGIRSVVIDKTHRPRWRQSSVADVRGADVDRCFESLGAAELCAHLRRRQLTA
jgi:enoyl-CoA hydratase